MIKNIIFLLCLLFSFKSISLFANNDSKELDNLLKEIENVERRPVADDFIFLRRIYLNAVGRIPKLEEIESFRENTAPDKRDKLIEKLVSSKGYESQMFNFFSNILRLKYTMDNNHHGGSYIDWVKSALAKNMPYDQFVEELIASEGPMWKKGNGATGYYIRDRFMLQDNLANTMRIFNGTRLECAQCHNHPFEDWKQKDFFRLMAFSGDLDYNMKPKEKNKLRKEVNIRSLAPKERGYVRKLFAVYSDGVSGSGSGAVKLPKDYQYDDANPNEIVTAKTILGEEVEIKDVRLFKNKGNKHKKRKGAKVAVEMGARATFAAWLTSPDNPHFTKVIVNRMWKKAFGYSIIDQFDDLTSQNKVRSQVLMGFLQKKMITFEYDLKKFQVMLYKTKHFQSLTSLVEDDTEIIQTPLMVRMAAEQIWDSLLTLRLKDINKGSEPQWSYLYELYERLQIEDKDELVNEINEIIVENKESMEKRQTVRNIQKSYQKKIKKFVKAKKYDKANELREKVEKEVKAVGIPENIVSSFRPRHNKEKNFLVRASERSSYPNATHLLNVFGLSNGDVIEGAHKESIPTQALFMLNGAVKNMGILNKDSYLMESIKSKKKMHQKISSLYMAILGRKATQEEVNFFMPEKGERSYVNVQDCVATLVCSAEFMFIQ